MRLFTSTVMKHLFYGFGLWWIAELLRLGESGRHFTVAALSWFHFCRKGDAQGDALDFLHHRRATTTGRSTSPVAAFPLNDGNLCTSPKPAARRASTSSASV